MFSALLAVMLYGINMLAVLIMNRDSFVITFLILLCFAISAVWRLAGWQDREGWHYVIRLIGDVSAVVLALSCVSTVNEFKSPAMKPMLDILVGVVCGIYGFSLHSEMKSISIDKQGTKET